MYLYLNLKYFVLYLIFKDQPISEDSPGSFKAIFESPKKINSAVDSNSTSSSTKRFIITPATLKSTSNA